MTTLTSKIVKVNVKHLAILVPAVMVLMGDIFLSFFMNEITTEELGTEGKSEARMYEYDDACSVSDAAPVAFNPSVCPSMKR